MMSSQLTPILLSLIVSTIEFVACLACTVMLWHHRDDVPDNSRRVLAAGAGFCIFSSLLKFHSIISSPVDNAYTEVLSPWSCNLGLLSLLLIVAYAVTVVRPGWFTYRRFQYSIMLPWVLLSMSYYLFFPFRQLASFSDIVSNITHSDVLLRVLTMPLTIAYVVLFLYISLGGVKALPRWIRNYLGAALLMYCVAALFVHTNYYIFHYIHQLYVALFYIYFTHYELNRRTYVSPMIPYPAEDADDRGEGRFRHFDAVVDRDRLYVNPSLSRDDYAKVMVVDRTTFSRIVIEQSGCPNLSAYLNRKRMAYAVELMRQHPNYTLQAIMEECGYTNKMTFNRVFKQLYGTTPSLYRDRL